MKLIKYQGKVPVCVEGFPEDTERMYEGALHLRPGQTTELSDDEYAYVKANRPEARYIVLLRDMPNPEPEDQG